MLSLLRHSARRSASPLLLLSRPSSSTSSSSEASSSSAPPTTPAGGRDPSEFLDPVTSLPLPPALLPQLKAGPDKVWPERIGRDNKEPVDPDHPLWAFFRTDKTESGGVKTIELVEGSKGLPSGASPSSPSEPSPAGSPSLSLPSSRVGLLLAARLPVPPRAGQRAGNQGALFDAVVRALVLRRPQPPSPPQPSLPSSFPHDHPLRSLFTAASRFLLLTRPPSAPSLPGRPFTAAELRLKSFDELHTLWFLLLREKNIYYTQLAEAARRGVHANRIRQLGTQAQRAKVRRVSLLPCGPAPPRPRPFFHSSLLPPPPPGFPLVALARMDAVC